MINPMVSNHFQNAKDSTHTLLAPDNDEIVSSSQNRFGSGNKSSSLLVSHNHNHIMQAQYNHHNSSNLQ